MKKILLVALIILAGAGIAGAATDSVTATVTVLYSSITLSQESFNYGSASANTATTTLGLFTGAGIIATNNGSPSAFDIYGANTTGGGTGWTLSKTTTTGNYYTHEFCNDTANDCTLPAGEANYTEMGTSTTVLSANVANGGTVAFQLRLTTPTTPTDFTQQSAVVTVQASAN